MNCFVALAASRLSNIDAVREDRRLLIAGLKNSVLQSHLPFYDDEERIAGGDFNAARPYCNTFGA